MAAPPTIVIPLQTDEHGAIRVSGTRVLLDVLIARHQQGYSPEAIHEAFPSVSITDIYAIIAYYLAHKDELDAYLAHRDQEAEQLRQRIEFQRTPDQHERDERLRLLAEEKRRERNA